MLAASEIAAAFTLEGPVARTRPFGRGRINDSYLVETTNGGQRVLLQRVNTRIFPDPEAIMHNVRQLQAHLERRQAQLPPNQPRLRLPELIPARNGTDWWRDDAGGFWRALHYIEESRTLPRAETPEQAAECGRILGRFHHLTWDLPSSTLQDTLPGFHILPAYLAAFDCALDAWQEPIPEELEQALAAVKSRRSDAGLLESARADGRLQQRVIHGDPKLDNILFDREGTRALALVDLDTIKPGLLHYDLGDCLRSICNPAGEADPQPRWELELCRGLLGGYLQEMRGLFSDQDCAYIYDCARLLPFELGVRFLTDHLQRDRYFKTEWRGQNLRRALTQFRLTALIENREPEIRSLSVPP